MLGGAGLFFGWLAFLLLLAVLGAGAYLVTTRVVDRGSDPTTPVTAVPAPDPGASDG